MKKALIFTGGWDGHEPSQTGELVRRMLAEAGFVVTLSDTLECLREEEAVKQYDLIVPVWTMGRIDADCSRNLRAAVAAGSGLAGWHGGMGDAFREDTEFQFMVGGQFVGHPGGCIDYTVHIEAGADSLLAGLRDFSVRSEQYYMHVDPGNRVLATTVFSGDHCAWIAGTVMPVVWTRSYGCGRVFYSSLGHCAAEFELPELREILRRGLIWAAR